MPDSQPHPAVGAAALLPRIIRLRDTPNYLGMDRNRFNMEVRPYLTKIPIGRQGIAFDRLELDAWVEDYISRNGRRPKAPKLEDDTCQNAIECRGSAKKVDFGTLKSAVDMHKEGGSAKALAHLLALTQKKS